MADIKTYTAEEFNKHPQKVYRDVDKNSKALINHSRYPDVIFELSVRERREQLKDDSNV